RDITGLFRGSGDAYATCMLAPKLSIAPRSKPTPILAEESAELPGFVRRAVAVSFSSVIEARDGRELFWILARAFWYRSTTDDEVLVALVDVRMPVYGGLDVLEAWYDPEPHVRVVITTP